MKTLLHNLVERSLQPSQGLRILHPVYRAETSKAILPQLFQPADFHDSGDGVDDQMRDVKEATTTSHTTPPIAPTSTPAAPLPEVRHTSEMSIEKTKPQATSEDLVATPLSTLPNHRREHRSDQAWEGDSVLSQSDVVKSPGGPSSPMSTTQSPDFLSTLIQSSIVDPRRNASATATVEVTARTSGRLDSRPPDYENAAALPLHPNEGSSNRADQNTLLFDQTIRIPEPQRMEGSDKKLYDEPLDRDQQAPSKTIVREVSDKKVARRIVRPIRTSPGADRPSAATAGSKSDSVAAAERHVTISIGRLELKVSGGKPQTERAAPKTTPTGSLDDFLRQRTVGGDR